LIRASACHCRYAAAAAPGSSPHRTASPPLRSRCECEMCASAALRMVWRVLGGEDRSVRRGGVASASVPLCVFAFVSFLFASFVRTRAVPQSANRRLAQVTHVSHAHKQHCNALATAQACLSRVLSWLVEIYSLHALVSSRFSCFPLFAPLDMRRLSSLLRCSAPRSLDSTLHSIRSFLSPILSSAQ
jgi:hypothetical protein